MVSTKGCNSENGTGRHGTSIQSGSTKLYYFLIYWRYTGRRVQNLRPLAYMMPVKPTAAQKT
jgi:hypothetical protein